MKKNKLIGQCPVCKKEMEITKLHCRSCDITIEGRFYLSKFMKLSENELGFVEVFIKNRGNIKEIEKELGISYPTVRNKLEGVIKNLGYAVEKNQTNKKEILDKVEAGEISAEEAVKLLNN